MVFSPHDQLALKNLLKKLPNESLIISTFGICVGHRIGLVHQSIRFFNCPHFDKIHHQTECFLTAYKFWNWWHIFLISTPLVEFFVQRLYIVMIAKSFSVLIINDSSNIGIFEKHLLLVDFFIQQKSSFFK